MHSQLHHGGIMTFSVSNYTFYLCIYSFCIVVTIVKLLVFYPLVCS